MIWGANALVNFTLLLLNSPYVCGYSNSGKTSDKGSAQIEQTQRQWGVSPQTTRLPAVFSRDITFMSVGLHSYDPTRFQDPKQHYTIFIQTARLIPYHIPTSSPYRIRSLTIFQFHNLQPQSLNISTPHLHTLKLHTHKEPPMQRSISIIP